MGKRKLPLFFVIWKRSIFNSGLLFLAFTIINIEKIFFLRFLTLKASYAIIIHKEMGGKSDMERKICAIVNGDFMCYNKQVVLAPDIPSPHAPVACLTFARGDEVKGGTAFMIELCCPSCCSALGSAGIKKIVYKENRTDGQDEKTMDVARYFDIDVVQNGAIGL